jgi:hypothetical protein
MSLEQIQNLNNRIKNKNNTLTSTEILVDFARETGSIADLFGRDYEVYNPDGEIVYRIRQKPMSLVQLNTLLKTLHELKLKEIKNSKKHKH